MALNNDSKGKVAPQPENKEDADDDTGPLLSEMERMAAKEQLQRIMADERNKKHMWTLQSQLSLLWLRSIVEPEKVFTKNVEPFADGNDRDNAAGQNENGWGETSGMMLETIRLADYNVGGFQSFFGDANEGDTKESIDKKGMKREFDEEDEDDEGESNETDKMIKKK